MGNHHQEKLPFAARAEGRSNTGSLWLPLRGNGRAQVNPEEWWHQQSLFVLWNRPNPKIPSQAVSLACCVCFRSQRQLRYYRLQRVKVSIKRKQDWDYISVVWCLSSNHMAQNQPPVNLRSQQKLKNQTPKYVYIMMAFINLIFKFINNLIHPGEQEGGKWISWANGREQQPFVGGLQT